MKYLIRLLFVLLVLPVSALCQQDDQADSLKRALITERADTTRLLILSDLAFIYANRNPDTALSYVTRELELAKQINLPRYNANAINDLAIVQYYKGDLYTALSTNRRALEVRKAIGDDKLILSSLNKIAVIQQELGNYDTAAKYQFEVLRIAEKLKKETTIGLTLASLSSLYAQTGKHAQARRFLDSAIILAIRNKDTIHLATDYTAMDELFAHAGNIDSALVYEMKAVQLYKSINAVSEAAQSYNSIGYLLGMGKKMYKEALPYLRLAMQNATAVGNKVDMAYYATTLGDDFIELKLPDSAHYYFQLAYRLYEPGNNLNILKYVYSGLSDYYMLVNNHDSAIRYNGLFKQILDSSYSVTSLKQINEMQARYESEKKEQQITLLNKQSVIDKLTINRKNIVIGVIAGSFIVAMIMGGLFYNRYRMKQEARLQEEILKQQHLASQAVISAEELERQRIASDLHDGIGQMFSAVKLNLSGLSDRISIGRKDDHDLFEKTLAMVDESCKEVRMISHQMMPNVLLKSGLAMAVRDFIDKIDEKRLKITLETFGLQQPLGSGIETVLYRVIQESVNNVIKHAGASHLDIQLHRDDQGISVTIEDDGVGFDMANMAEKEGIGLKSVKARVEFLKGKVDYDTAPGKGTLVAIFIPAT